jgi:hypothetical protein
MYHANLVPVPNRPERRGSCDGSLDVYMVVISSRSVAEQEMHMLQVCCRQRSLRLVHALRPWLPSVNCSRTGIHAFDLGIGVHTAVYACGNLSSVRNDYHVRFEFVLFGPLVRSLRPLADCSPFLILTCRGLRVAGYAFIALRRLRLILDLLAAVVRHVVSSCSRTRSGT